MANTKEYKIVINGLQESIDAVKSLNEQLKGLEDRIKVLQDKAINIKTNVSSVGATTSSASKSASSSVISTENEIIKQQNEELRLQAKINAARDESFKALDATKAQYKEIIADQKQVAAQERINADAYSHTMQGMKQQLADLKAVINTTVIDEPDGLEKIAEYTKKANELTDKLKKMEEAYGQFGRNVGKYQSALDGLDKYKITIGGVTREFDNAKQAAKILSNELLNLPKGAKGADELHEALLKIRSDIADLQKSSSVMDNLLDTMESFTAIANVGQGIRGLFGVDDAEMQKSIKNLVALQNILKGIETINKQIKTGEGVGGWIKPLNAGVDTATKKLLTLNTALLGTGNAAKVAAVSINVFSKALKLAVSAGVLIVVDLLIEKLMDLVESFKKVDKAAEEAKEAQKNVTKAYAEATAKIKMYQVKVKTFNGTQEEEKRLVKELNSEFGNTLGTYDSLAKWMDVLVKKGEAYIGMLVLQAKAQASFNKLVKDMEAKQDFDYNKTIEDFEKWYDPFLEPFNRSNKTLARQREEAERKRLNDALEVDKKLALENQKKLEEYKKKHGIGEYAPQIEKNGKKTKDAIKKVDDELIKLRIRNMKEGLNKVITQLEEERKAELRKIEGNSREAGEKRLEINKYYDNKIREEIKSHTEKSEQLYKSLNDSVRSYELKNYKEFINTVRNQVDIQKFALKDVYSNILDQGISSYGIQGKGQLSPEVQFKLKIISEGKDEFIKGMKELVDAQREAQTAQNSLNTLVARYKFLENDATENVKKNFEDAIIKANEVADETEKAYNNIKEALVNNYGEEKVTLAQSLLLQENYSKSLSAIFEQRYSVYENYWDNVIAFVKASAEVEKTYVLKQEELEYEERKDNALKYYNEQLKISNDYYDSEKELIETNYNNGLISESEYYVELENLEKDYEDKQKQLEANYNAEKINLQKQHEQNEKTIEQNRLKKLQEINKEYYEFRLQELRDFQTAIANLENKQPVMNAWGITNFSKTDENNRNLLNSYETLAAQIISLKEELQRKLKNKEITFDDFQNANRELDSFADNVGQKMDKVKYDLSLGAHIQKFIQDIQGYLNEAMNSFQTIMQAVWDAEDVAFDKQQDELDKWNEELDKKLDEQQEIVEKHKDAIDSIEDELATARGSRRQHLIDQINAEMEAQREARRQEQKIQKEKEKAEKKQEELDKKRKKAEYERNMLQAIVNGAMAVTFAAMNNWPVPAIPMMALAAATTAAQVAIMAANKPYAKGGVLEGPSHKQGGIPVGNTGIEVEGKEYVIRKKSTTPNVELLDMINRSERKLTLDDFINFYSSGKLKKNISSMSPKTVFADGGTIPTLSNDIDINDRLLSAMEAYAERPVVVSVVDILNRTENVKSVQVLAGLSD